MGNDQSTPEDRNEAKREEVLFTISYTRHGPKDDVYEENRKYTGRWGIHDANERLRFFKKVVAGAAGLQGSSQYRIRPPLAGIRVDLTPGQDPFPGEVVTGPAPFTDLDGASIFVGSTEYGEGVYPCKLRCGLQGHGSFALDGSEVSPMGNSRLLPIDSTMMEWITTSHGKIPRGRVPVDGGYEPDGSRLYHALVQHDNLRVPGKTGEHLVSGIASLDRLISSYSEDSQRGMQYGFDGYRFVEEGYEIL